LASSFITCGDELLGEEAGGVVCDALDLLESSDVDVLCC